jgi:deoxyguanosine kinase
VRRFVVIEGLIGVGKSTLTRLLAREWGARLVMEPSEQNPFLEPFYQDPLRFAFPVQMYYLSTRWRQQEEIRQGHLFHSDVVADYLFAKDRLFAEKTLNALELELYDRFAGALTDKAPVPDLVVYLEAPIDVVMGRIAERNAPGEYKITEDYLVDLKQRYERMFDRWSASPLLRIDNRDMDYREDSEEWRKLLSRIEGALRGAATTPGSPKDREAQPELFGGG